MQDNVDKTIKLRILANSNSSYDQEVKMNVKYEIQQEITNVLKDKNTLNEVRDAITNDIDSINDIVDTTLKQNNVDYSFKTNYGMNYFPEKEFNNKIYKEGYYESLVITLGSGKGDNWWCLLFPKMCLVEINDNTEYKLWFKEVIDNI